MAWQPSKGLLFLSTNYWHNSTSSWSSYCWSDLLFLNRSYCHNWDMGESQKDSSPWICDSIHDMKPTARLGTLCTTWTYADGMDVIPRSHITLSICWHAPTVWRPLLTWASDVPCDEFPRVTLLRPCSTWQNPALFLLSFATACMSTSGCSNHNHIQMQNSRCNPAAPPYYACFAIVPLLLQL